MQGSQDTVFRIWRVFCEYSISVLGTSGNAKAVLLNVVATHSRGTVFGASRAKAVLFFLLYCGDMGRPTRFRPCMLGGARVNVTRLRFTPLWTTSARYSSQSGKP